MNPEEPIVFAIDDDASMREALSRLFLDNIYSIGASWVTMGPHIGQVALAFGASDMGSVMMEENVVSSAGTTYCLDEAVICRLISSMSDAFVSRQTCRYPSSPARASSAASRRTASPQPRHSGATHIRLISPIVAR